MGSLGGRKKEVYRKDGKGVETDGKWDKELWGPHRRDGKGGDEKREGREGTVGKGGASSFRLRLLYESITGISL